MERRAFLKKIIRWISSIAGAFALAFPIFSFVSYRKPNERKVIFKPEEQLSGLNSKDGVFLENRDETLHALSSRCTHLGCTLRYDALSEQFRCPCHGSVFDRSGRWISGPAGKDLHTLAFEKLDNGDVVVIERFG